MTFGITRQPDFLKTDAHVAWCWGNGNEVWGTLHSSMTGDMPRLKSLIARDPNLIRCQCGYRTPLHFAVRENQLETAKWLLSKGADYGPTYENWHDDPIQMAQDRGHTEMARYLESYLREQAGTCPAGEAIASSFRGKKYQECEILIRQHGVNVADHRGNKPIHWAAMTRQRQLVTYLLNHGADVNSRRLDGARPLDLTNGDYFFRGWVEMPADHEVSYIEMIDFLLAKGAHYDLTTACRLNDIDRVQAIIANEPGAARCVPEYITWYSGYPLRSAAKAGHREIVQTLLDNGADPNQPEHGLAPFGGSLYDATQNGHIDVLKLLLQAGGNPNQEVESSGCVLYAARDSETVALLREHGAIFDAFGCCFDGHTDDFRIRCERDPFEAQNSELFAMAAERNHREIVNTFLEFQPDLWERAPAYLPKQQELIPWMVDSGLRVNNVSWMGIHQLHHGCSEAVFKQWIELGTDVDLIDGEHQSTPLGWAARRGDVAFAKLLLASGADPRLAGEPWATPEAWAARRGHRAMSELLSSNGA